MEWPVISTAVLGYLLDAVGIGVQAWGALLLALVITGGTAVMSRPQKHRVGGDLVAWLGIVAFLIAALLRFSWPALVPPGRGPDLTHHLLLVDYIEQQQHLLHDRAPDGAMGEMAHYTPESHQLAVMAGTWFGTDGLHTFFPLAVLCAALTAGFVFLIARRHELAMPYAISAAILLMLPAQYFFGAFTHDSFLAQTVSTLFAVAMWWAIVSWDDQPSISSAAMVAVCLCAVYLSWPIWLGPPLLVFVALALHRDLSSRDRYTHLAIVIVPFLLLAGIGALGALSNPCTRITVAILLVIALQTITPFAIAKARGASTPYMAFKMFHLAIYPMAVLAGIVVARTRGRVATPGMAGLAARRRVDGVGGTPALAGARNIPVVNNTDLYTAGKWMRANVGSSCADYLVADADHSRRARPSRSLICAYCRTKLPRALTWLRASATRL
jgi:hypothetical protein